MFISLPAQRNEPKKGHPGVIVIRPHSIIFREFQTHPSHSRMKFHLGKCLVRPAIPHGESFYIMSDEIYIVFNCRF